MPTFRPPFAFGLAARASEPQDKAGGRCVRIGGRLSKLQMPIRSGTAGVPRALALWTAAALAMAALSPMAAAGSVAGAGGVVVTSPADGALVTGMVDVAARAPADTISVSFQWSRDGGDHWELIAVDSFSGDGWTSVWDTGHFSGRARVRATATTVAGERSDAVVVQVDNKAPNVAVRTSHGAFSPNGDGRLDKIRVAVLAGEPAKVKVMLKNRQGRTVRTWSSKATDSRYAFTWAGRARDSRVGDGRFRFRAVATDRVGLKGDTARTVIVDTRPPRVYLKRLTPVPLRRGSRVRVRYTLRNRSGSSHLRFPIRGANSKRTIDAGRRLPGTRTLRMRFAAGGGRLLPTAGYRVGALARDHAGNVGHSRARPWLILRAGKAHVYTRLNDVGRKVALTFDDCYDIGAWRSIVRTLHSHHLRATFFCNGIYVAAHPRLARRTVRWGNAIGNHTPRHALQTSLPADSTERQLKADIATWWRVAKATPAPYFRPPYGAYDGATLSGAGAAAHTRVVLWDIDTQDYMRPGSSVIARRALQLRPGSIVLMHAISQTAGAMPRIIEGLRRKNLSAVTIPRLFKAAKGGGSLARSQYDRRSWRGLYREQRDAGLIGPGAAGADGEATTRR